MKPSVQSVQTHDDVRNFNDSLQIRAYHFIRDHYNSYLDRDRLYKQATAFLQKRDDLSEHRASMIALRALCEYESNQDAVTIDLDHCTSFMVVVNDLSNRRQYAIPATEIHELIKANGYDRAFSRDSALSH